MESVHPLFFQRWSHSREEDTAGARVYRPSSYSFPPSRYREAIEFNPDGSATCYGPGADDRYVGASGHWKKIEEDVVRTEFADERGISSDWKLTEMDGSSAKLETSS